jgi:4a-hydroxytetrahydrobiopterin dehydratase
MSEVDDHAPAIDVRPAGVTVRLVTLEPDHYGLTALDISIARRISVVARNLGLVSDPSKLQSTLVIVGAPDIGSVMPFWRAALGYEERIDSPDEDLVDPDDRGPALWFESMEEPRPGGGAVHLAVWLPAEQAEARVASALAAGGRMVRDEFAPSWWTLADAAGNEADISTVMGQD